MRRGGVILVAVILFLLVVPNCIGDGNFWQDLFYPRSDSCNK